MMLIIEYNRINQKLVCKTYHLTRIGKTIKKLEGFQYEMLMDIKMGYCTT